MAVTIHGQVARDAAGYLQLLVSEEPAVLVEGPRGSGKSTLVRQIAARRGGRIIDLDDEAVLALVEQDPSTALTSPDLVVVDEFQRAPAILSVVKRIVDREGGVGRFLLAGSVSAALLPTGSETLTGRVQRMTLEPLQVGEALGTRGRLLHQLLADPVPSATSSRMGRPDYFDLVAAGGYPAALARPTQRQQQRWFASYLSSVAVRDLPDVTTIRHPGALMALFRLAAEQTSSTLGRVQLGERLGISAQTARSYLDLLSRVHLVRELPGWTVGVSAKTARRSKIHVSDTGLGAAAVALDAGRLAAGVNAGPFLESFVVGELTKQAAVLDQTLTLAYFRDRGGAEVDVIVEGADGRVFAFEVKSATRVNEADSRGLKFLRDRLGDRFATGIVLFTGPLTARLGDRIWALPVAALWGGDPPQPPDGGGAQPPPRRRS
jgi:uncharacterized protein